MLKLHCNAHTPNRILSCWKPICVSFSELIKRVTPQISNKQLLTTWHRKTRLKFLVPDSHEFTIRPRLASTSRGKSSTSHGTGSENTKFSKDLWPDNRNRSWHCDLYFKLMDSNLKEDKTLEFHEGISQTVEWPPGLELKRVFPWVFLSFSYSKPKPQSFNTN